MLDQGTNVPQLARSGQRRLVEPDPEDECAGLIQRPGEQSERVTAGLRHVHRVPDPSLRTFQMFSAGHRRAHWSGTYST